MRPQCAALAMAWLLACNATTEPDAGLSPLDGGALDASDAAPAVSLAPCPTSGEGAIEAPAGCVVFTPAHAGADPSGVNAAEDHYALEPSAPAHGILVVHLHGSLGTPRGQIVSPDVNVYTALAAAGYHVIGLAYRADEVIGSVCDDSACFGATREALVFGRDVSGSAVSGVREDEGIVGRLNAALRVLGEASPGWDRYRVLPEATEPSERIAWERIITSGHSQGGGHAAYLARTFALRGVLQLSSTCDAVAGAPAEWTASGPWATSPAERFIGFSAPDDVICRHHAAVWEAMGLDPSRRHDDAIECGGVGAAHAATLRCEANLARLAEILAQGLAIGE